MDSRPGADELSKVMKGIRKVQTQLIERHNVGWFDGGCYTLASALHQLMGQGVTPYHVSRSSLNRDHAVVRLGEADAYLDADGIQTQLRLFRKMRVEESTPVTMCAPFTNLNDYPIYQDVVDALMDAWEAQGLTLIRPLTSSPTGTAKKGVAYDVT
ncbi:hypothetical protein AB6D11_18560 [Vibrio splendidus]